ncbi:uncharacterized protein LOC132059968 isoform X1 [Lycium ferocissimum]|uniref:uncharacterized protein LOC132059968 isoform X1 n=1 Tax=Lycium ferocissimum TaxID=112874 RepID=UPI002815363F|nr:uncharacterized protein LOC132059968 isoform X1 [Lycium ferocissimum]
MFLLSFCRNLLFLLLIFFCIFKFSSDFSFSWLNFMAIEGKIKLLGHKYSQAIALYTQMIKLNSENVVYWANHVFAHIKLKEYCSVIEDGAKANEIVPRYSKVDTGAVCLILMGCDWGFRVIIGERLHIWQWEVQRRIQEFSTGWYCFLNILSCISCILLVIIKLFLFFILKLYHRIYLEKNIAYVTSYHI